MNRSARARHALPLSVLVLFTGLDVALGREQVVLGLLVIAPLAAASTVGRRATGGYTLLALLIGSLLGIYDQQYTSATVVGQTIRLLGVALGGAVAVVACSLRLRSEEELRRLSTQAATTRAAVEVAEVLQRNLLGPTPDIPCLDTAVRYLPATRHAEVGGDWYDAFPVPDGSTMLVIGDVAGHDAPAAAVMAQTRGMLRALAQSCHGSSPASVLSALDRVRYNLALPTLVTVAAATVDLRRAANGESGPVRLLWSNAGHPPPVLICADGRVELLERVPDRLIGVSPDARRADHELELHAGDTLFLYTDGLVERRTVSLDAGTDWLVEQLRRIGREPLEQVCDDLVAEMGTDLDDDVALLAVRIPGAGAQAREGALPQR